MTVLFWTALIVLIVISLALMYPSPKKMSEREIILFLRKIQPQQRREILVNDLVYTTGYSYGGQDTILREPSNC
jgi:hypothetical protein